MERQSDFAALFVFNNESMLEQFYNRVRSSAAEIEVQPLAEVLGGHIIEDTVKFLTQLAREIHKAVGVHLVWAGLPRCCLIQYRDTKEFGNPEQLFWNSFFLLKNISANYPKS